MLPFEHILLFDSAYVTYELIITENKMTERAMNPVFMEVSESLQALINIYILNTPSLFLTVCPMSFRRP